MVAAAFLMCAATAHAQDNRRFSRPESFDDPNGQRYYVVFRDSRSGAAELRRAGAKVAVALPKLNAVSAYIPEAALDGLERSKAIEYIEIDPPRFPMAQTTPYGISMVQADSPNVPRITSGNTTVCIIDSGYYAAHADLQSTNVTTSPDSGTGQPVGRSVRSRHARRGHHRRPGQQHRRHRRRLQRQHQPTHRQSLRR